MLVQDVFRNWVDIVIFCAVLFYAFEGYRTGFVASLIELMSFVVSFALGLKLYGRIASAISLYFPLPHGFSNAIGFLLVSIITDLFLRYIFHKLFPRITRIFSSDPLFHGIGVANKLLGTIPGVLSGIVVISFILTVIVSLPVSPVIQKSVTISKYGNLLVAKTQRFDKNIQDIFGLALNETLTFLTVEPGGRETIDLHFKTTSGKEDKTAEIYMLELVNKERVTHGQSMLVSNTQLTSLALSHGQDMLRRGYFSHYTPEGLSPFTRMDRVSINYTAAGENLAFAPSTDLAMEGLMNSPGHRANILSSYFHSVGIGVIDAGIYGEIFVQEFTN